MEMQAQITKQMAIGTVCGLHNITINSPGFNVLQLRFSGEIRRHYTRMDNGHSTDPDPRSTQEFIQIRIQEATNNLDPDPDWLMKKKANKIFLKSNIMRFGFAGQFFQRFIGCFSP